MRIVLLLAALAVAVPTAAAAERPGGPGFDSGSDDRGRDRVRDVPGFDRDDDDRRDRRGRGGVLYIDNDRDLVSDRAFQRDSFNDWWHDAPSRAYPAWVARNAKCERMWWSGGGWTC